VLWKKEKGKLFKYLYCCGEDSIEFMRITIPTKRVKVQNSSVFMVSVYLLISLYVLYFAHYIIGGFWIIVESTI